MLGVHVRTFQRWAARYEDDGEAGLADRRVGRRSPRRAPQEELDRMLGLYRDKYAAFTVKHFHEQLVKRHGYKLGYTVTKLNLHAHAHAVVRVFVQVDAGLDEVRAQAAFRQLQWSPGPGDGVVVADVWGSAPAPLRDCAHHHSSCVTLRLRFNLPQPGVSIIRAAPQCRA
jgi:hypothetical protein